LSGAGFFWPLGVTRCSSWPGFVPAMTNFSATNWPLFEAAFVGALSKRWNAPSASPDDLTARNEMFRVKRSTGTPLAFAIANPVSCFT
jgi:hypothetical protein